VRKPGCQSHSDQSDTFLVSIPSQKVANEGHPCLAINAAIRNGHAQHSKYCMPTATGRDRAARTKWIGLPNGVKFQVRAPPFVQDPPCHKTHISDRLLQAVCYGKYNNAAKSRFSVDSRLAIARGRALNGRLEIRVQLRLTCRYLN